MLQKFARRSVLTYGLGGASALLLGLTSRSQAAAATYKADLNAASEVPPNQSAGKGSAAVTYDDSTKTVTWQGTFTGLSGPATAAHIHGPAEAGKNAGVIVAMSQNGVPFASPFQGSMKLADDKAAALASALAAGQAYVNIHTAANPGGEIRGQLAKS
jgi:hypothetical protein